MGILPWLPAEHLLWAGRKALPPKKLYQQAFMYN